MVFSKIKINQIMIDQLVHINFIQVYYRKINQIAEKKIIQNFSKKRKKILELKEQVIIDFDRF